MKPDILLLTETWLHNSLPSKVLEMESYNIYRRDRKGKGGGLLTAVNKNILSNLSFCSTDCEILSVDINISQRKIRIINVYNPTTSNTQNLKQIVDNLKALIDKVNLYIIIGDFNLPNYDWKNPSLNHSNPYHEMEKFIIYSQPIHQMIDFATRGPNLLDIVLTNSVGLVRNLQTTTTLWESDHCPFSGTITLPICEHQKSNTQTLLNFKQAVYSSIGQYLLKYIRLDRKLTAQKSWDIFETIINTCIRNFVPKSVTHYNKSKVLSDMDWLLYRKLHKLYNK